MHLLRGVDQQEEQREGARRGGGERKGKRVHALEQLIERRCAGFLATPRPCIATKGLDDLECLVALETPDDAPERRRELADVFVEREIDVACWEYRHWESDGRTV
jgi:hypothetical protein